MTNPIFLISKLKVLSTLSPLEKRHIAGTTYKAAVRVIKLAEDNNIDILDLEPYDAWTVEILLNTGKFIVYCGDKNANVDYWSKTEIIRHITLTYYQAHAVTLNKETLELDWKFIQNCEHRPVQIEMSSESLDKVV